MIARFFWGRTRWRNNQDHCQSSQMPLVHSKSEQTKQGICRERDWFDCRNFCGLRPIKLEIVVRWYVPLQCRCQPLFAFYRIMMRSCGEIQSIPAICKRKWQKLAAMFYNLFCSQSYWQNHKTILLVYPHTPRGYLTLLSCQARQSAKIKRCAKHKTIPL